MGQKVNPHGLRVGVIKDWDSVLALSKIGIHAGLRISPTSAIRW